MEITNNSTKVIIPKPTTKAQLKAYQNLCNMQQGRTSNETASMRRQCTKLISNLDKVKK